MPRDRDKNPWRPRRTKDVPKAEPRAIPVAHPEPRSYDSSDSNQPRYLSGLAGDRRKSGTYNGSGYYKLEGGDPCHHPRTPSSNGLSPSPTQSRGVCGEKDSGNGTKEFPVAVMEGEPVVQASSSNSRQSILSQSRSSSAASRHELAITSGSILPDQDSRRQEVQDGMSRGITNGGGHQGEAVHRIGSAWFSSLPFMMSAFGMSTPLHVVAASFLFSSLQAYHDLIGTAESPPVDQDLDFFSDSGETDRAFGNHNSVDGDELSFAAVSSMSQDMCMESSGEESFVFDSQSPPSLDARFEQEIENLVSEIAHELVQGFVSGSGGINVRTPQSSGGSPTSSNGGDRATTGSCSSTEQATNLVRSSNMQSRHQNDGNEEPRRPKRPRVESPIPDDLDSEGLLACPYAKYDPDRYSEMNQNLHEKPYRRCRSVYLTNIPRLKQHLYRIHRRPEYFCSSCYTEFKAESDCEVHARARPACVVKDCPFQEKMTHEQYKAVKRRKMCRDTTSVWFGIFDILFPGAQRPGTPYVDDTNSQATMQIVQEYTTYLQSRLPQMLSERMGVPLFGGDPMTFQWLINKALEETLPTALRESQESWQMMNLTQ